VSEAIDLSCGVVSGVGGGMGVLDGGPRASSERGVGVASPLLWGVNRHFQAKRAKYSDFHIMETTAWIPTKFCVVVKTTKHALWVVQ